MTFNIDKVKEAINELSYWEQVNLWNERCEYENYMDDYIYNNDPMNLWQVRVHRKFSQQ